MATILVVDDELGIRALLTEILSDEGHTVEVAEDAASARVMRERLKPDLVLLDIWMPDVDGVTLLKEWNTAGQLTMPVIMMSGHGTIDTAVEAMKFGAAAFLEKPVTLQKLLRAVEEGLNRGADPRGAAPGMGPRAGGASGMFGSGSASGMGVGGGVGGGLSPGMGAAMGGGKGVALAHTAMAALGLVAGRSGATGVLACAGADGDDAMAWAARRAGAGFAEMPLHAHAGGAVALNSQQSFELDRPLREARDAFEKCYFEYHLAKENGSMTRVAEKTGLERTHLYRKLKHLGVDLSRAKRSPH